MEVNIIIGMVEVLKNEGKNIHSNDVVNKDQEIVVKVNNKMEVEIVVVHFIINSEDDFVLDLYKIKDD